MPFSSYEAFTEFVRIADPDSFVLKYLARSLSTIAIKMAEVYEKVLKPELSNEISHSPY